MTDTSAQERARAIFKAIVDAPWNAVLASLEAQQWRPITPARALRCGYSEIADEHSLS